MGWLVHLCTASGAVLALVAARAALGGSPRTAFLALLGAVAIDGVDGLFARALDVRGRLPHVDGARLDDIVDYTTYVFVPGLLLLAPGVLPPFAGPAIVAAVAVSSALAFSRDDAKTSDGFFTGFPSYWNIVALYVYALGLPSAWNAAIVATLCALVFVPIGYVYPTRMVTWRAATLALAALWFAALVFIAMHLPRPPRTLVTGSLLFPLYYAILSVILHIRREARFRRI
jgi:phosphatidylcholine synthase